MSKKRFISLNIKLSIVVIIAVSLTLSVYFTMRWIADLIVAEYYTSDEAIERQIDELYDDLERYIDDHAVEGKNPAALLAWLEQNHYVKVRVSDNFGIYFDATWVDYPSKSISNTNIEEVDDENAQIEGLERIKPTDANDDGNRNRIIRFYDDEYYVFVDVFKQQQFYAIMQVITIGLCTITLIGIILAYNGKLMRRMIKMSQEVKAVSEGNLGKEIKPVSNDEIGRLAVSIDNMRDSIVERLQSEKAAWESNTNLITAMSHDIRTPLTSLIGYLDIIEGGKYSTADEMNKHIRACKEKANQLKDLSDKLFQYFLVFGAQSKEKNLEVFDAGILMEQIISEHSAELMSYGFEIDLDYRIPEITIKADISRLKRLFDNIFSNILKYGDKEYHISITAAVENDFIMIRQINRMPQSSRKVESNNIGLKTCERICSDMGGSFHYDDDGNRFSVRIALPTHEEVVWDE